MNLICLKSPLGYLRRASTDGRLVPVENFPRAGGALEGDGPAHRGGVTPGREGATIVPSGGLHKLIVPFRMRSWECPIGL
jgi:hypothetical protein